MVILVALIMQRMKLYRCSPPQFEQLRDSGESDSEHSDDQAQWPQTDWMHAQGVQSKKGTFSTVGPGLNLSFFCVC